MATRRNSGTAGPKGPARPTRGAAAAQRTPTSLASPASPASSGSTAHVPLAGWATGSATGTASAAGRPAPATPAVSGSGPLRPGRWVLLIYTVPAEPSRKRAAIWRELKKIGAEYLRDGVCVLPQREGTVRAFAQLAAKVDEFGGRATVIQDAQLDDERAREVRAQMETARAAEYGEVQREAERFLEHVAREREHREIGYPEVEELEADLGKLRRWTDQIRTRDYFDLPEAAAVSRLLARCEDALAAFLDQASTAALERDEAPM